MQDISYLSVSAGNRELSNNSTLSLRIDEDFPPLVRVFCHVLDSTDNSTIGIGMRELQIGGKLKVAKNKMYFKPTPEN